MHFHPGNFHLYVAKQMTTSFRLRDREEPEVRPGTAFGVRNAMGAICIVTNRHMVDAGYGKPSDGRYLGAELTSVTVEGFRAPTGDSNALPSELASLSIFRPLDTLRFAKEYHEDVACFMAPQVQGNGHMSFCLQGSDLADDAWIHSHLSVFDLLAFPGFPPWHDKLGNRAILRTGSVASDPRTNWSNVPEPRGRRIAFEGFSFGGSSGSPMFAPQRGLHEGDVVSTGAREGKWVGINAGHLEGDPKVHSGVSYFIKSSAILDLINGG